LNMNGRITDHFRATAANRDLSHLAENLELILK